MHAAQPHSPSTEFYSWLSENAQDSIHPRWVRRTVEVVYSEYKKLPPLTRALLHTDPEPEDFVRNDSGDVGVIDWAESVQGPALYDLASAITYAGGEENARPLVEDYARAGFVPQAEISAHLPTLRRLRAGVQAEYFSRRVHHDNHLGVSSAESNEQGLLYAQPMLRHLGVPGS